MKSKLLLLALACSIGTAYAGDGKDGGDEVLRKSGARTATNVSYPVPFNPTGVTARTQPAISTGYYLVDNRDTDAGAYWVPDITRLVEETTNPVLWHDILTGPRQQPAEFWTNNKEGHAYFRNPGALTTDSTDNAFAGPIPIGLNGGFVFNGVRYDSFYVSTNGIIALSNRRYYYNPVDGQRYIPPGATSAYDPQSDDTRARSGDGLNDATPDNYGYQFIALNNDPTTPTAGIRNPANISFENNAPANPPALTNMNEQTPLIAPFWDDLQLSVYNRYTNQVDDFGRVRYYRSPDENFLTIFYKNLTPIGTKTSFGANGGSVTTTWEKDIRPNNPNNHAFVSVDAQILLDGNDNSITYLYKHFEGTVPNTTTLIRSQDVFRSNSTIGVRGYARHVNFVPPATIGAETRYLQTTEYLANNTVRTVSTLGSQDVDGETPERQLAIKFKQWKNPLRVVSIKYNVPKRSVNFTPNFDSTLASNVVNNYELLAGDPILGSLQPVGIFQNLTNDIQGPNGVNYQAQNLNFRVRFRIINVATGLPVYNQLVDVNHLALSNPNISGVKLTDITGDAASSYNPATMNGVPPYGYVQVRFPAFETNEFIDSRIGRLRASIIAVPTTPDGESLRDEWPFDDTTSVNLFNIRRMPVFNDDVREYHVIPVGKAQVLMPSVTKWVNINGEVVNGDDNTYNPPPPLGEYAAHNRSDIITPSPVILLNRTEPLTNNEPVAPYLGGDQIISFPIDLRNRKGAVLSISVQRTGKPIEDWARGWADNTLLGPEIRAIINGTPSPASGPVPDSLLVEFARSDMGMNGITNIPPGNYRFAPRKAPLTNVTNNYAFTLFGGGGHIRGYALDNYNSALTPTDLGALVSRTDDDGKDQEFYKIFIPIPDTIINTPNEGAKNFRFRLRVGATRHTQPIPPQPQDDSDDFYIDNVRILYPTEVPDIELSSMIANWPYTIAPASQAIQIPVRAKIANNTSVTSQAFSVNLRILRNSDPNDDVYGVYGVGRAVTIPFLPGNQEIEIPMPNWNARNGGPKGDTARNEILTATYKLLGHIANNEQGGDLEPLNDTTYSFQDLTFGPVFAYDPIQAINDVPAFSQIPARGLNLPGAQAGDVNSAISFGPPGGLQSGQMSMRFTIYTQDTLQGYSAYFAGINQDPDHFVTFALYGNANGAPGNLIPGSYITRLRGQDADSIPGTLTVDKYTNYRLDKPVVLPPGEYWAAVGQTYVGFELGASASRSGMVTTHKSTIPFKGAGAISLYIDKRFRRRFAGALVNDNRFAYQNTTQLSSAGWNPFAPSNTNIAYAHLDHFGTNTATGTLAFESLSQGSWIPMIRPYIGKRAFNQGVLPVELSPLAGESRNGGASLWWSTASELNNSGFNVERRELGSADWTVAGFVKGKGNSSKKEDYNYYDANLAVGTYEYRLRQVDLDGSESFSNSVEIEIGAGNEVAFAPAYPNPFSAGASTAVKYSLPTETLVKVEIVDVFGKVVRTLVNEQQNGTNEVKWDGRNDAGMTVASGSYIYRIVAGETTQTGTITFVQ
jgi:hypothetical protein